MFHPKGAKGVAGVHDQTGIFGILEKPRLKVVGMPSLSYADITSHEKCSIFNASLIGHGETMARI